MDGRTDVAFGRFQLETRCVAESRVIASLSFDVVVRDRSPPEAKDATGRTGQWRLAFFVAGD